MRLSYCIEQRLFELVFITYPVLKDNRETVGLYEVSFLYSIHLYEIGRAQEDTTLFITFWALKQLHLLKKGELKKIL